MLLQNKKFQKSKIVIDFICPSFREFFLVIFKNQKNFKKKRFFHKIFKVLQEVLIPVLANPYKELEP